MSLFHAVGALASLLGVAEFIFSAFLLGFVAAIPVGATQLEIIRHALKGQLSPAILLTLGATAADIAYGCIAFFGVLQILRVPTIDAIFWLLNSLILVILGIWAIHSRGRQENSRARNPGSRKKAAVDKPGVALATGFSLGITNPLMMSWWIIGARFLDNIGTLPDYSTTSLILYLLSGGLGLTSYSALLAYVVKRVQKSLSEKLVKRITLIFGIILLCLAVYFALKGIRIFLHH